MRDGDSFNSSYIQVFLDLSASLKEYGLKIDMNSSFDFEIPNTNSEHTAFFMYTAKTVNYEHIRRPLFFLVVCSRELFANRTRIQDERALSNDQTSGKLRRYFEVHCFSTRPFCYVHFVPNNVKCMNRALNKLVREVVCESVETAEGRGDYVLHRQDKFCANVDEELQSV